MYNHIK